MPVSAAVEAAVASDEVKTPETMTEAASSTPAAAAKATEENATPATEAAAAAAVEEANTEEAEGGEEGEGEEEEFFQEPRFILNIKTPSGKTVKLQAALTDSVLDIRQYLQTTPDTCDLTCYHLEHDGNVLHDFVELQECPSLQLEEANQVLVVCDFYDERLARQHVQRLRDILVSPPANLVLNENQNGGGGSSSAEEESEKQEQEALEGTWNHEEKAIKSLAEARLRAEQELEEEEETQRGGRRGGRHGRSGKGRGYGHSGGGGGSGRKDQLNPQQLQAMEDELRKLKMDPNLFGGTIQDHIDLSRYLPLHLRKEPLPICLENLTFSAWNPPPGNRRLQGDLFYLEIQTLEKTRFSVTASVSGFFVNRSTRRVFDPTPSSAPYTSHTLAQLLRKASPLFDQQFTRLTTRPRRVHPFEQIEVPLGKQPWTLPVGPHAYDWNRAEDALMSTFGMDDRGITRDWNEEYQSCRDLPGEDLQQRTTRDRMLHRVYCDFVAAATKGALAIIHGNIPPVNPMEDSSTRVYIYNDLFFSFAVDDHVAAMDNLLYQQLRQQDILNRKKLREERKKKKQEEEQQGEEDGDDDDVETHIPPRKSDLGWSTVSFSQANHDINGIRLVTRAGQPGISTVATVLVDYCGKRVIVQSIIPGIFHTQSSSGHVYGSMDHGKTVQSDPKFHELVSKVAESLSLKEHEVVDGEGTVHKLGTSVDTKGIRGSDGRLYLLDLIHMAPRDLNYPDPEKHGNHLLRPELINHYAHHKAVERIRTRRKKEAEEAAAQKQKQTEEEKEEAQEEDEVQEGKVEKELTEEEKAAELAEAKEKEEKRLAELQAKREAQLLADRKDFEAVTQKLRFNPDIGREAELHGAQDGADPEAVKALAEDRALVEDLSKFLVEVQIPSFVRKLKTGEISIPDSIALKRVLHEHGINLRYLGRLARLTAEETGLEHIQRLLEQEMIIRSAKRLLYQVLEDSSTAKTEWGRRGGGSFASDPSLRSGASPTPFSPRPGSKHRVPGTALSQGHEMSTVALDISQFLSALLGPHAGGVGLSEDALRAAREILTRLEEQQRKQMLDLLQHQLARRQLQVDVLNSMGMGSWINPGGSPAASSSSSSSSSSASTPSEQEQEPVLLEDGTPAPTELHTSGNLWLALRDTVQRKFEFEFPEVYRMTGREKQQILRALCIQCGIQITSRLYDLRNFDESPELSSEDWEKAAAASTPEDPAAPQLAVQGLKPRSRSKKKQKPGRKGRSGGRGKSALDQLFTEDQDGPIYIDDILGCIPVVKSSPPLCADGTELLKTGRQLIRRGALEEGLALLMDALNVFLSVYGAMHQDTAACYEALASLFHTVGDAERAVDHQQRAVIILERTLGLDDPLVAAGHLSLAVYLHQGGFFGPAKYHAARSMWLYELISGPYHPESAQVHSNLALIYIDEAQVAPALLHLNQARERFTKTLGEVSAPIAMTYHHLAVAAQLQQEYDSAVELEEKASSTWRKVAGPDSTPVRESLRWLAHFKALSDYAKRLPPGMTLQDVMEMVGMKTQMGPAGRTVGAAGTAAGGGGGNARAQQSGAQLPVRGGQVTAAELSPEERAAMEKRARKRREKKKRQKERKRKSKQDAAAGKA